MLSSSAICIIYGSSGGTYCAIGAAATAIGLSIESLFDYSQTSVIEFCGLRSKVSSRV